MHQIIKWAIIAIPIIYLVYLYPNLPQEIPSHFDLNGNPDHWSHKYTILVFPLILLGFMSLLFPILKRLDPKKNLAKMKTTLDIIELILIGFTSAISILIIQSMQQHILDVRHLVWMFGLLFIFMGILFPRILPNYFIGIRTPWTLENEKVWTLTHVEGGKIWQAGGAFLILVSLFIRPPMLYYAFLSICLFIVIYPVVYSYFQFKKLKI